MLGATMLMAAAEAQAAEVRFVHAVPGADGAVLSAGGARTGAVRFGEVSGYADVRDGRVELRAVPAGGGRALATSTESLRNGHYTVVAEREGEEVSLRLYADGRPRSGAALIRVVHAAPELGEVAVGAGARQIARRLEPGEAGSYVSLDPGSYDLKAMRPGSDDALASQADVALVAGTATTAIVVGSGGEALRFVLARSGAAAPSEAPGTGLGGLDGGAPWALAAASGLAAGVLGGLLYAAAWRRRRA
jgi:hypothetical protein